MPFSELRHEQARQLVDVDQVFRAYRAAKAELDDRFAGSMFWREIEGRTYLYRKMGATNRSLGARSPETDGTHAAFHSGRDQTRERVETLTRRINEMAPVNRALGLGRVPAISARILRRLDAGGLVGKGLIVTGTTALFAYERGAAVQIASGLLATGDIDLLFDARRRLRIAAERLPHGLIGALRKVDRSFTSAPGSYRATNGDGFMVDLIKPMAGDRLRPGGRSSLGDGSDLQAAEIEGFVWLVNSPKVDAIVVDERGFPLAMTVPDPRSFALHKVWVSRRADREPIKRGRDLAQARLVADFAVTRQALAFDDVALSALPAAMRRCVVDIVPPERVAPAGLEPDW